MDVFLTQVHEEEPAVDWAEEEDQNDAASIITTIASALDAENGPPTNSEELNALIKFLWFGEHLLMLLLTHMC